MAKIHPFIPSKLVKFWHKQIFPHGPFYATNPHDPGMIYPDYNKMKDAPFGQLLMFVPINLGSGRTVSFKKLLTRLQTSHTEICRIVVHGIELPYPVHIKLKQSVQFGDTYQGPLLEISKFA